MFWSDTVIAKTVYHFRDEYGDPRLRKSVPIRLEAGKSYKFRIEAQETYADAQVQLVWDHLGESEKLKLRNEAIETAKKADAVVMFMGLTARLEGEEMDVEVAGFRGGDRTSLDLPQAQADLIKAIKALGKPVVLVLLNGSALAINWESQNVGAILEAWYPGQAAGTAIADVLFGDYNPGGKLPVTFYKSANDLPAFDDYHMKGHTYRYFTGKPLYPFGYGLSYTTFDYSDFSLANSVKAGDSIKVNVKVRNSGKMDGDEVVQVYASSKSKGDAPIRSLVGFQRVRIGAGDTREVELTLRPDAFVSYDETGNKVFIPGEYEVSIGGGQPGYSKTLSKTVALVKE